MSSGSEVRILRDETARLIAEIGRMKREFATRSEELATQLAEATARIAMLEAENRQLRQHIKYYENPHTPPLAELDSDQAEKGRCRKGIRRRARIRKVEAGPQAGTRGGITQEKADRV